tara:strand:- start:1747 stop:2202 length:456 start_codon:yes stop_codon:yes gene_type:complete
MLEKDRISKEISDLRSGNKIVVFTNGCFDLLHQGHIDLISMSSTFGDILVIGLNSDESVKRLKGDKRPIQNVKERKNALIATGYIDKVYTFERDTPLDLILKIKPDIIVKGGDYVAEDVVGYSEVINWGGKVKIVPITPGFSTTSIIGKMR